MPACNFLLKRGCIQTLLRKALGRSLHFWSDDCFHVITLQSRSHIKPQINVHVSAIEKRDLGKLLDVLHTKSCVRFVKLNILVIVIALSTI